MKLEISANQYQQNVKYFKSHINIPYPFTAFPENYTFSFILDMPYTKLHVSFLKLAWKHYNAKQEVIFLTQLN